MKLFIGLLFSVGAQVASNCAAKCEAMYQPDKDKCNQIYEGVELEKCLGKCAYYIDQVL